jgi:hypothetical protein
MRTSISVLAIVLTVMAAMPRLQAQSSHAADQAALDAAVERHVSTEAGRRAAVLRTLERSEVREQAGRFGIDLRAAKAAVGLASGAQLDALVAQAGQVDQALAGGQSKVVISTTTIIIGLLIIILLVVAID